MSRKLLPIVCGLLAIGSFATSAAIAAPTLTLGAAADPTESITTQLEATGTSESNSTLLEMTLKPTGGQACSPNFAADDGTSVFEGPFLTTGPFAKAVNHIFASAGSYLLCGWLVDDAQPNQPVVASASLTIAVRTPHIAFSIVAPPTVETGQVFQISTTAQAEVGRRFTEYLLANAGRGCPANASAATSTVGFQTVAFASQGESWEVNGGAFSETSNETIRSAGQYLVCGFVQYPNSSSTPELTASTSITAVAPPPPCVVPAFSTTTRLKAAEAAIRASGCGVGKVKRVASRRIRSGYVLGLNPSRATHLAPGAAVNITVSTGPPCIVPHVFAGTSLAVVEFRLAANHCAVGKISTLRSRRYRRGRVLRLGARTGQVLASHFPIAIVVASRSRRRR
jgi:hypothetical protein